MTRLADLEQLADGWNGPGSKAIPTCVFANYATLAASFGGGVPDDLEPMAWDDGSIDLEWSRGEESFHAQIQADGGLYLCHLTSSGDDVDRAYPRFDAGVLKAFYMTSRIEATGE